MSLISCVGPDCPTPDNARVIDAEGGTVLPAYIDMCTQFYAPSGDEAKLGTLKKLFSFVQQRPEVRKNFHRSGISAIRSTGDALDNILALRLQIAEADLSGPKIYASGLMFTAPGGYPAAAHYAGNEFLIENGTRQIDRAEEATRIAQALLADKRPPNGLKAVYEDFDGAYPKLSEEGLAALGKVASEKATWLAVHTESNAHLREALAAGATIIEYGSHEAMDSLTIASLASSNALFLPMLGRAKGNPDRLSILQENVSKVYQAGGQLGVGSDAQDQLSFGNSLHEEMSLLVEAGVPALEVIKAATQVASRYLKADDIMGGLQVGKLANVLVIKGKPYEQIQDSYKLQWMLQEGKWIIENQELIDP